MAGQPSVELKDGSKELKGAHEHALGICRRSVRIIKEIRFGRGVPDNLMYSEVPCLFCFCPEGFVFWAVVRLEQEIRHRAQHAPATCARNRSTASLNSKTTTNNNNNNEKNNNNNTTNENNNTNNQELCSVRVLIRYAECARVLPAGPCGVSQVKVLHLVRDPRAVLYSRLSLEAFCGGHGETRKCVQPLCQGYRNTLRGISA